MTMAFPTFQYTVPCVARLSVGGSKRSQFVTEWMLLLQLSCFHPAAWQRCTQYL